MPDLVRLGVVVAQDRGAPQGAGVRGGDDAALPPGGRRARVGDGERRPPRTSGATALADVHARLGPGLLRRRRSPAPGRGALLRSSRAPRSASVARRAHGARQALRRVRVERRPSRAATASSSRAASRARARSAVASGRSSRAADEVERRRVGARGARLARARRRVDERARTGARVWKTSDPAREKRSPRASASADASRESGSTCASRAASASRSSLEATTERGARARASPATRPSSGRARASRPTQALREKLGRLGDTPFALGALEVDLPARRDACPLSSLNRARRALVDALASALARRGAHADARAAALARRPRSPRARAPPARPPLPGAASSCSAATLEQATPRSTPAPTASTSTSSSSPAPAPRSARCARVRRRVQSASRRRAFASPARRRSIATSRIARARRGPRARPRALCRRADGRPRRAGSRASATSRSTSRTGSPPPRCLARGLAAFTPSFDLDAAQLAARSLDAPSRRPFAEVVVHHPMPLFHMEHCVIAALLSEGRDHKTCGRPCETPPRLAARSRRHGPPRRGRRRLPQHRLPRARRRAPRASCRRSSQAGFGASASSSCASRGPDVGRLVEAYRALLTGQSSPAKVWQELRASSGVAGATGGGYGVVRGSLRVLP